MSAFEIHSVLDEIRKNELVGVVSEDRAVALAPEMLDSFVDSFLPDPDAAEYMMQIADVLEIQYAEQRHLFELLGNFISSYAQQVNPESNNNNNNNSLIHNNMENYSTNNNINSTSILISPSQQLVRTPRYAQPLAMSTSPSNITASMILAASQKKRQNFPREITSVLTKWLYSHEDHPYPTEEEKTMLGQQTGLSMSQISGWFINARRRKLKKQT